VLRTIHQASSKRLRLMPLPRSIPWLLWCCLLAACAAGETGSRPTAIVRDSAGVQLVHNPDPAIDTTSVPLTERLRIGVMDGPEVEQFHFIRGIAVSPNGTLYIANQGSSSVRVFSLAAEFVREIGRKGTGPGEFDAPGVPLLWKDTLFVSDGGSSMVHMRGFLFDTLGNLRGTTRYLMSDGSGIHVQAATSQGWVVTHSELFRRRARGNQPRSRPVVGQEYHDSVSIRLLNPHSLTALGSMSAADLEGTLKTVAKYARQRSFNMISSDEGGVVRNSPLFEPSPTHSIGPDGLIHVARGWPYVIDVFDLGGRWIRRISRAHSPVAITDDHVRELLSRAESFYSKPGSWTYDYRRVLKKRAEMPRIGFLPVTGRLQIDGTTGALWVERVDITSDPVARGSSDMAAPAPSYWDVFNARGEFQHMVRLPVRFSPRAIRSGTVYGVQRDENDVEYVVALGR
jgi:hypothetical protein